MLRSVKAVGEDLRTGDIAGVPFTTTAKLNKEAMVEVIRSPDRVVVVVVSTNAHGYNNLLCHVGTGKHWTFSPLTIDAIELKDSPVTLANFTEIVAGQRNPAPSDVTVKFAAGNTGATLSGIHVDDKTTLRVFTFDVAGRAPPSGSDSRQTADTPTQATTAAVKNTKNAKVNMVSIVQSSEKPAKAGVPADRFAPKEAVPLRPNASSYKAAYTIRVNRSKRRQQIEGFGGAFTDSSATIFSQLNATLQERVLGLLWGPEGQKYNLARLTIGSTDFSTTVYNYNQADSADDFNQSNFALTKHDTQLIIPMIHRAQRLINSSSLGGVRRRGGDAGHSKVVETVKSETTKNAGSNGGGSNELRFLATSWSPPGWMKQEWLTKKGYMRNSAKPGLRADPRVHASYALYLSKYVKKRDIRVTHPVPQTVFYRVYFNSFFFSSSKVPVRVQSCGHQCDNDDHSE